MAPFGLTIRFNCSHMGSNGITESHLQAVVPYSYGGSVSTISTELSAIRLISSRQSPCHRRKSDADKPKSPLVVILDNPLCFLLRYSIHLVSCHTWLCFQTKLETVDFQFYYIHRLLLDLCGRLLV